MGAPHYLPLDDPAFSTRSDAVKAARAAHWCARTPYGWAVLRHREVGQLLRDRRLRQGSYSWPRRHGMTGAFTRFWEDSVIGQEGEGHKRLRALAVPALAPEHIAALVPDFETIAKDLFNQVAAQGGACDFMSEWSQPFAGRAICLLLGMDQARWPEIAKDASDLGLAMGIECLGHQPVIDAAYDRLAALAAALIARARAGEDRESYVARLTGRFDAAEWENDDAREAALSDMVVISIFGGVDTTRAQLALLVDQFIRAPGEWEKLRADPTIAPKVVEEIIRARPTTTWSTREALEDFEFGGEVIRKGETVHMFVHASARDPAVSESEDFDVTAARKIHFGFGGGAHACLGAGVARSDMAAALRVMARRVRGIGRAGEASFHPDSGNTAPIRLPVRFDFA